MKMIIKKTYFKPKQFCKVNSVLPVFKNIADFIDYQKSIYHTHLDSLQLTIRLATMVDKDRIMRLRNERFTVPNSYSTHWLYHLLNYGSCLILENTKGELVGYKFEATYMDELKTSFTAGTAVRKEYSHLGLGKLLIGYTHLIAKEKGAMINRGIIDIVNYPSVYNFINYFGGIFIEFEPHFEHYGPRLIYEIPIDEYSAGGRCIDFDNIKTYMETHQEEKDYKIVTCNDVQALSKMYQQTNFKIIALLPKTFHPSGQETYFAIKC